MWRWVKDLTLSLLKIEMASSDRNTSPLLAICEGNSPVTGEFPHKGQWRGALMFSLICAWINDWVNNREAADLRRHCTHYDITVFLLQCRYFDVCKIRYLYIKHISIIKGDQVFVQFNWSTEQTQRSHVINQPINHSINQIHSSNVCLLMTHPNV